MLPYSTNVVVGEFVLSAACGFSVFAPFPVLSVGVRFFDLSIPAGLNWIASWPSLICFSVAMLAEVAAYCIPWIDNALDLIAADACRQCAGDWWRVG